MMTSVMKNSKIAVLITAAGSSTRMGGSVKKEYLPLNNGTVISSCAKTFLNTCLNNYNLTDLVITCPVGGIADCNFALKKDDELQKLLKVWQNEYEKNITIVEGADSRQKSVYNGLLAISQSADFVLIHDGARPFVTPKIIEDTIAVAIEYGASVPGITPTDTQKQIDENGFIVQHLQRSLLTSVQTPQGFKFAELLECHKKALQDNKEYTDDTEIWGKYAGNVKVVPGDVCNIKITYPEDLKKLN